MRRAQRDAAPQIATATLTVGDSLSKSPTLPGMREGWGTPKYFHGCGGTRGGVTWRLRFALEDAGEGLVVFGEEDEPADGADQAWANADGEHQNVEDQDVDDDGADERQGQRDVAVDQE